MLLSTAMVDHLFADGTSPTQYVTHLALMSVISLATWGLA